MWRQEEEEEEEIPHTEMRNDDAASGVGEGEGGNVGKEEPTPSRRSRRGRMDREWSCGADDDEREEGEEGIHAYLIFRPHPTISFSFAEQGIHFFTLSFFQLIIRCFQSVFTSWPQLGRQAAP